MQMLEKAGNYLIKLSGKNIKETEQKSYFFNESTFLGGYGLGLNKNFYLLTAYASINYYNKIQPVAKSINIIAQEFSNIQPLIYDNYKQKYIREYTRSIPVSKFLDLMKQPNFDLTGAEFLKKYASFYEITGNAFLICASFSRDSEPIELYCANSQDVNISPAQDGLPAYYEVKLKGKVLKFLRDNLTYRFYCENAGISYEIWHTRNFNPNSSENNLFGLSPLNPIFYEIEHHLSGNIHNLSMLNKGARPSGVFMIDGTMNDDQYNRAREMIQKYYQGAENAGSIMLFEGDGGKNFIPTTINNRDMDFAELKKVASNSIYTHLNIPLPFVGEQMTYSNYEESKFVLYDLCILPLTSFLYDEIERFIFPRYKNSGNYSLAYDKRNISALELRHNLELERFIKLGLLTYNEGRQLLGKDPLKEGGDSIYQPAGLVPVGQVQNTSKVRNLAPKEKFISSLKKQKMSDLEISNYVAKIYG